MNLTQKWSLSLVFLHQTHSGQELRGAVWVGRGGAWCSNRKSPQTAGRAESELGLIGTEDATSQEGQEK